MFTITSEPTFRHNVIARVPVDGGFKTEEFKATFRVIPPEEHDNYDLTLTKGSSEFLRRVVVSMDEVADVEGKPVEWSDEVLEAVLKLPWARAALARAYFTGIAGAREGN